MNIRNLVGVRIKELRIEAGLSQERLANMEEIGRTYITKIENGKKNVIIQCLLKLCDGLNISLKEFFNSNYFDNN